MVNESRSASENSIWSRFTKFLRERYLGDMNPNVDVIADKALNLAMDWGEDFLKPTQDRMAALYPSLTREQLDQYDVVAREAMKFGQDLVYQQMGIMGQGSNQLDQHCLGVLSNRYPWAANDTLNRVISQGRYYGWKDGVGA